ncbi:MAG TPA: retropepsin-like aspartic protease [Candidatus Acidoferrales bacterium]
MKTHRYAIAVLLFMMNSPSKAQPSAGRASAQDAQASRALYQFSSGDKRIVIPFDLTPDGIFFQSQIAGSSEHLWFSLDTGSGSSYLDLKVANRLGLKTSGSGTVHGAGAGTVPVNFIESVTFELPGLTSSGHRVNATDLTGLQGHHRMDGFLGYDFISRYVVTLDYAAGKMTIVEPTVFTYSGPGGVFPIQFRGKWPYIAGTIVVPGVEPETGEFLVDSGSGDAVDADAILKTTGPVRKIKTGVGLGQPGEGVLGRAIYFQLGPFRMDGPITSCCSSNPDDLRKIGTEVLRRFTVILDYPHKRIILEPNGHFKEPFPDA